MFGFDGANLNRVPIISYGFWSSGLVCAVWLFLFYVVWNSVRDSFLVSKTFWNQNFLKIRRNAAKTRLNLAILFGNLTNKKF